jgi:anti-sigma B factor antagonist
MHTEASTPVFSFSVEVADKTVTVRCRGRLVFGVCNQLVQPIKELLPANKRVVLDLRELTHMDSTGLGTVVRLYVSAKAAGTTLELCHISPHIRQILGITNLLSVLTEMCEQGITLRF